MAIGCRAEKGEYFNEMPDVSLKHWKCNAEFTLLLSDRTDIIQGAPNFLISELSNWLNYHRKIAL